MFKSKLFLLISLLVPLLALGCSEGISTSVSNSWKGVKGMYYEYVNPAPEIDLNATLDIPDGARKLAPLMVDMDRHLDSLLRILTSQESIPSQQTLEKIIVDFPWIGGLAVIDPQGQVMASSLAPVKEIDFAALAAMDEEWTDRTLRCQVQDNVLGPEVCMVYPFFEATELRGLTVIHFDMRSLVALSGQPQEVIVFTADQMLWTGRHQGKAEALAGLPWSNILKDEVAGEITAGGEKFFWMARYIGNLRLVYATTDDMTYEPGPVEDRLDEPGPPVPVAVVPGALDSKPEQVVVDGPLVGGPEPNATIKEEDLGHKDDSGNATDPDWKPDYSGGEADLPADQQPYETGGPMRDEWGEPK